MDAFLICRTMLKIDNGALIEGKEIHPQKWNQLLSTAPIDQQLFSSKWFLDIVHPDWFALVMGDYEAALVLPKKKRMGISYLVQPQFCQKFSMLGKQELFSAGLMNELNQWLTKKYLKIHFCLDFKPPSLPDNWLLKEKNNCRLIIESEFREAYSSQIRRHLKQAEKFGLQSNFTENYQGLLQLFEEHNNRNHQYYKPKDLRLLEELLSKGIAEGKVIIQEVHNPEGELLSGAVWFVNGPDALFFFSARKSSATEKGFFSWMIDFFISNKLKVGGTLDFEGSDNFGLRRFYMGFGSLNEYYFEIRKNLSISFSGK